MRAIQAQFDGKQIILPKDFAGADPTEVIVVFQDRPLADDRTGMIEAQHEVFERVWDNSEDSIYDQL